MADEEEGGNDCPFSVYVTVGDGLWTKGHFSKALDSYSKALEMESENKGCLVARARCHLSMGNSKLALADAEAALKQDKNFVKALYQKAEALYAMGEFEFSMVFYHRGNKLRPELEEFKLGIQKAQEAIENCVGTPETVKLDTTGNLDFLKEDKKKSKGAKRAPQAAIGIMAQKQALASRNKPQAKKPKESPRTVKQLLGDIYADKEYLEKLLEDKTLFRKSACQEEMQTLMQGTLDYLDKQTEFWRQQKPIYARKNEYQKRHHKPSPQLTTTQLTQHYYEGLIEVQNALDEGRYRDAWQLGKQWMRRAEGQTSHELPAKASIIAQLHSSLGTSLSQEGRYEEALVEYKRDLDIGRREADTSSVSRALDNIGRTLADLGRYEEAIRYLKEKLPLATEVDEKTWLNYTIGSACMKLEEYDEGLTFALAALQEAQAGGDDVWLINANVLLANIKDKTGDLAEACHCFEVAIELSHKISDTPSEEILQQQLVAVRGRMAEKAQGEEGEDSAFLSKLQEEENRPESVGVSAEGPSDSGQNEHDATGENT